VLQHGQDHPGLAHVPTHVNVGDNG